MGCDLGFNGGGWPIWVVVGLVVFSLRSGFRCVGLVFWWLRSRLLVFDLLVVCSLLVCREFARRGYGFCFLWVWVLLGGDHGLLFLFFYLGVEC